MRAPLRSVGLMILASSALGAHCKEDCGAPAVRLVGSRQLEHTLYGAGVLIAQPRTTPLAAALAVYERAELRVDVSRRAAVVLVTARAARSLARRGGESLRVGDRGDGYRVVAIVDQAAKVTLFADAAARAEAERAGYDAVMLLPREGGPGVWEASVAVDLGRRVERRNDDKGRCIDADPTLANVQDWALVPLPPGCGDGVRQSDEDCDTTAGGCSPYCLRER